MKNINTIDSVILDSIHQLNKATTIKQIGSILKHTVESLGFTHYYFGLVSEFTPSPQFTLELGKYARFLQGKYDLSFKKVITPILHYCQKSSTPVLWNGIELYDNNPDDSFTIIQHFVKSHHDKQLHPGILIPVHNFNHNLGLFYLWNENKTLLPMNYLIQLQSAVMMLSVYSFNALKQIVKKQQNADIILTPRERQCLTLCREGKSYKDISQELGISKRTVTFHITNLFDKLDAHNKVEAINKAQNFGLIDQLNAS